MELNTNGFPQLNSLYEWELKINETNDSEQ